MTNNTNNQQVSSNNRFILEKWCFTPIHKLKQYSFMESGPKTSALTAQILLQ